MSLRVLGGERARILAHAARAYPEEGCGVLIGRDDGDARVVLDVMECENQNADSRQNRYVISPQQFLAAERRARERGLDVVGFFHSHPDHPARPSAFDLEHAWPYYSYLIVSVEGGRVAELRSFRLADDRSRFDDETLEGVPADGAGASKRPSSERGESR